MSDYAKLTVAMLKEKCETNGLDVDGRKADLVKRLEDHDSKKDGADDQKASDEIKVDTKDVGVTKDQENGDDEKETPKKRGRGRPSNASSQGTPPGKEDKTPTKKRASRAKKADEDKVDEDKTKDDEASDDKSQNGDQDGSDEEPKKKVARTESETKLKRKSSSLKNYGAVAESSLAYGAVEANKFKVVSWNVNGLRSILKGDCLFAKYLRKEEADVVCVQETKLQEKDVGSLDLKTIAGDIYPHRYFACSSEKKGYAGTAIFSKSKPLSVQHGIGNKTHDGEGRVLTLEFEKFFVVTSYTPNSGQKLERLKYRTTSWDKDFLAFLQKLDKTKAVVWTGDLNVAHNEIDIADPKGNKKTAGFTAEERESFSQILKDGPFVDSFRHLYPEKPNCFTWWSVRANCKAINKGWRLDYFVVSERLMGDIEDSFIRGPVDGSDHCPIGLLVKTS